MHTGIGKFCFSEEFDGRPQEQSFAATQVHQHGTPYVLIVERTGGIVFADRRAGCRELLASIGPSATDRLPDRLARIVTRHGAAPPVEDAATVMILQRDVVVSVNALDIHATGLLEENAADAQLFACSLWRFQRARALQMAKRRYMLTNRECELLDRILHGEQSSEIARLLSISLATVEWHTKRLLVKTDSHNRTQMATRTLGWLPDPE